MSIRYLLCISVLTLSIEITAQPYLYFKISNIDSNYGGRMEYVNRYNILTKTQEVFPANQFVSNYVVPTIDPTSSYLNICTNKIGNTIFNCNDTSIYYEDYGLSDAEVEEMLYSSQTNKLFIFWKDYLNNPPASLSVFDLSTGEITDSLTITNYVGSNSLSFPKRNAFFSSDKSKIYFYSLDTLNGHEQIWTYAIANNEIIDRTDLSTLGYGEMDGYNLIFGRNGKGIINSYSAYNNPIRDFYYRLYDFDTDSGYTFIYNGTYSYPYLLGSSNYLILFDVSLESSYLFYTGTVKIFNSQNGVLIKNISFPPGGRVYTFDNWPDDLYYVINIDSPKRQIFSINADSLLKK